MMNRALLQRQMFANGGAAVPNQFKGFSKLPEEVQMKMNPQLAQKYEEGGDVTQGFDPANPYNIAKFFRDNPGTTVSDYNSYFGTNLDPKEFAIFEKPKPMEEGGVAGLMSQPDMAAMPMGSTQEAVDPAVLETALQGASEEVGDLEQAGDFKSMMDQFSGENKSEEERRDDLASIVGPEDAAQTPDSVLALVTPVVQISMMDQGIAPMAQEAMDTPVEGDMAGGIMSMTGAGNEPPVNFNQGGEVLRRGDEDPVEFFDRGGVDFKTLQSFMGPRVDMTPEASQILSRRIDQAVGGNTPTYTADQSSTDKEVQRLKDIFENRRDVYKGVLGDPEEQKKLTQAQILFDIANTALTFSAPMPGEKKGLSPAQRLALAATTTKLPQTIGARAQALRENQQKLDLAALTASEGILAAEKKGEIELEKARLTKNKFREVKPANIKKDGVVVEQIDLNSQPGRTRFNNLGEGETVEKLTTKSTKKLAPKIMEVRDKINPSKIESYVNINDEDFNTEAYNDKLLTTVGEYDAESDSKSYKPIQVTFNGVTTTVDQNSEAGQTLIEKANKYNTSNPNKPQYNVTAVPTERTARGFLVEFEDGTSELVTSLDGGKSFFNRKTQKYMQSSDPSIKGFNPINDTETFKIIKIQNASKEAKTKLKTLENALVDTLNIPGEDKKDMRDAFQLVRDATGPYAKIIAGLDAVIGGFVPLESVRKFFQDDVKARLYVKSIGILGRAALAVNPRLAVADLETTMQLFPDPDRFFANPETEVQNLRKVKSIAVRQLNFLNRKLAAGEIQASELSEVNSKILEIEKLIDILNPIPLDNKATGAGKNFTYKPGGKGLDFKDKFIQKKTGG
jgi:hypothetical protein